MATRIYSYNSEIDKWDVGKFPRTSKGGETIKYSFNSALTIYDVTCPDLSTTTKFLAIHKDDQIQHIKMDQITSLDVTENIIKINTSDEVAFYMYCRNNIESNKIENRIFLLLSGELDPGC